MGDETTYGYAEFPGEFTCFCITYADSIAYLDNQTYLPVADSGEINLNSGEFTYFMEDMTVGGALMPIPICHYFNADNTESKYGKLWNLSLNQHLEWVGNPTLKAVYTDSRGKEHYFICEEYGEEIKCLGGLDLGIYYDEGNSYCVTDRDNNRFSFDGKGALIGISDKNGNGITITRNTDGTPIKLTDTFGRITTLTYSNSKLTGMTDPSGRTVSYEYDENSRLIKAIWPDNSTVEYTYTEYSEDEASKLISVKDRDGLLHVLKYTDNKLTRVEKHPMGSDAATNTAEEYIHQ